ncbi:PAS domain S-box protein [Sphingobium yanoikuyae]|jgi:PAS domain S-box-containing protein|uniref:PAS domain S-box protein n=1 Tax=Sphingobium yanoikuyae TaxID=13690 RepID=UPI0028AA0DD7|nr:PAS domain S-box protein [Sphingobium yanoikuyae]
MNSVDEIGLGPARSASAADHSRVRPGGTHDAAAHLAAIVESSDDAILTKDLDGIVTSWNEAAERLFGYSAPEIIGKSITLLLPYDRQDEEAPILARLRRGERVRHYETVRRRKDGSLVDISLSVSPLRDPAGTVIGASTIARDISERKQAEEQQRLLLHEMDHRIRNLFTLSASLIRMSSSEVSSAEELATIVQERLGALARAHALTISKTPRAGAGDSVGLHALLETIVAPYQTGGDDPRIRIVGGDLDLAGAAVTALALIFYELATNAAKHGALSSPSGAVTIEAIVEDDTVSLIWDERGALVEEVPKKEGFGSKLERLATGQLGGDIEREWQPDGVRIVVTIARERLGTSALI